MVRINGTYVDAAGVSLTAYLAEAGCRPERIAVECNGQIIPKSAYSQKVLADGDELEIVSFVGGG